MRWQTAKRLIGGDAACSVGGVIERIVSTHQSLTNMVFASLAFSRYRITANVSVNIKKATCFH
jgi:hypothetical protein